MKKIDPTLSNSIEFPAMFEFRAEDGSSHQLIGVHATFSGRCAILDGALVAIAFRFGKGFAYKNGNIDFEVKTKGIVHTNLKWSLVCGGKIYEPQKTPVRVLIGEWDTLPLGPVNELLPNSSEVVQTGREEALRQFLPRPWPANTTMENGQQILKEKVQECQDEIERAFQKVVRWTKIHYLWLFWSSLSLIGIPGLIAFHRLANRKPFSQDAIKWNMITLRLGLLALCSKLLSNMSSLINSTPGVIPDEVNQQMPALILVTVVFLLSEWSASRLTAYFDKRGEIERLKAWGTNI